MRNHIRISHQYPIELHCKEKQEKVFCRTRNISAGGMLVSGAACVQPGDELRINMNASEASPLTLKGHVIRRNGNTCVISFVDLHPTTSQRLQDLLSPHWDGHDLLEGVITIAPWIERNDLASWLRYTSILSEWKAHTPLHEPNAANAR